MTRRICFFSVRDLLFRPAAYPKRVKQKKLFSPRFVWQMQKLCGSLSYVNAKGGNSPSPDDNLLGDFKRTNVRLPRDVHAALKRASSERDATIEDIVLSAVEKELGFGSPTAAVNVLSDLKHINQMMRDLRSALDRVQGLIGRYGMVAPWEFANRFIEASPLPMNVKWTSDGKIAWCNQAYAQVHQLDREEIVGRTLKDFPQTRLEKYPFDGEGKERGRAPLFSERLVSAGREQWFFAHEFQFGFGDELYTGDLSFSFSDVDVTSTAPLYFPPSSPADTLLSVPDDFCAAFLESIQTVALVKDPDGRIVWCNNAFLHLARVEDPSEVLNRTSTEIFSFGLFHSPIRFDQEVVMTGKRVLGRHSVNGEERLVAHFPIIKDGKVEFIGLLSCTTQDIYRATQRKRGERERPFVR